MNFFYHSYRFKSLCIVCDYFSKWVEAIPTSNAIDSVVINFLEENILARFGCPRKIITDNAQTFKSVAMIKKIQKYNII